VIPDEAVEAAARAFNEKLAWCDRHSIDPRREDGLALHAALEVAAPYRLAAAWGEGHRAGWNDRDDDAQAGWTPSGYAVDTPNPYRSQP